MCCSPLAIVQQAPHFHRDPASGWDRGGGFRRDVGLQKDCDVDGSAISKARGVCQASEHAYTNVNVVALRSGCVRPSLIVTSGEPA